MAVGFYSLRYVGLCGGQDIVSTMHYRVANILPVLPGWGGSDDLADTFISNMQSHITYATPTLYTLKFVQVQAYNNALVASTSSPWVTTVNAAGQRAGLLSTSAQTITFLWVNDVQIQITGALQSKRNRGYICFGPVMETDVNETGLIDPAVVTARYEPVANHLRDTLVSIATATSFIPVTMHKRTVLGVTSRTYSDILGYRMGSYASFRRSRLRRG